MSARSLNRVMLIGNLTRDPELRYTPQGTAVCTIGLATNRSWMPADGSQRQEETEYHRIVAWAKLAEICSQLLYKGRKVYVEGRLQTRRFTGQDGNEREITEVVIDSMIALGAPKGKEDSGDEEYSGYSSDYQPSAAAAAAPVSKTVSTPPADQPAVSAGDDVVASAMDASDEADSAEPKKQLKKADKGNEEAAAPKEEVVDSDDIPF